MGYGLWAVGYGLWAIGFWFAMIETLSILPQRRLAVRD